MMPPTHDAILAVVRKDWGRILSVLVSTFGDFQLAEDALQDAVLAALKSWAVVVPDAPDAWLITTAKRRALDRIRRNQTLAKKTPEIAFFLEHQQTDPEDGTPMNIPDKRLEMLFTCCHPALEPKTQTALTLRTLGGLTVEEIAAAFLDKPATMAQRLSRARTKIKVAGIPYKVPEPDDLPGRLASVLQAIYLIFNEGYAASSGEQVLRCDLIAEAIGLGQVLCDLMPDAPEAAGLLALMLLHDARRAGRTSEHGAMIALQDQDRSLWDTDQIARADCLLRNAMRAGMVGPYQLQAAIAALHAQAPDWDQTDWPQIVALYGVLMAVQPSPVVDLNRAVAMSFAGNLAEALAVLDGLSDALDDYSHFHAARADMLARDGQGIAAANCFQIAINLSGNAADRQFLQSKMGRIRLQ